MITLKIWVHPVMQLPVSFSQEHVELWPTDTVADLMAKTDEKFEELAAKNTNKKLQIVSIWGNLIASSYLNHQKALKPHLKLSRHFEDGDTFRIYGELVQASHPLLPFPPGLKDTNLVASTETTQNGEKREATGQAELAVQAAIVATVDAKANSDAAKSLHTDDAETVLDTALSTDASAK